MTETPTKSYNFPVYATQGGGRVREAGSRYIFVEPPPDFLNLQVGDYMPEEWSVIPVNDSARQAMLNEEFGQLDS